jgi:hypothetical protein
MKPGERVDVYCVASELSFFSVSGVPHCGSPDFLRLPPTWLVR